MHLISQKYIKLNPDVDFIFGSVKKHWGILYGYRPKKIKYSWGFYSSHSTGFFIKRTAAKTVGLYNTRQISCRLWLFLQNDSKKN